MKCWTLVVALWVAGLACAQEGVPKVERIPGTEVNRPIPGALAGQGGEAGGGAKRPAFIVGVWYQPASSFISWKVKGINTLLGYESEGGSVSMEEWSNQAVGMGMYMIRQPKADLDEDAKDDHLLAWLQPDEPETKKVGPDQVRENYLLWKKHGPQVPVLLNISGGDLLFKKTSGKTYREYFAGCDWVGNDFYPITGWNQPTWIPRMGQAIEQCRELSGGKPQIAFVETSHQQLAWLPKDARGVTPGEMRAEVWHCVIHGARGVVYFPQQFNPFKFDATPPLVGAELFRANQILGEAGELLAGPMNPKEVTVTVQAPMEAGWRRGADGRVLVVVLNLSNQPQFAQPVKMEGQFAVGKATVLKEDGRTLNVTKHGFVDDFEAFGAHVYEIGTRSSP